MPRRQPPRSEAGGTTLAGTLLEWQGNGEPIAIGRFTGAGKRAFFTPKWAPCQSSEFRDCKALLDYDLRRACPV
jgi:hypothetical protein